MERWQKRKGGLLGAKTLILACGAAALVWIGCFMWWGMTMDVGRQQQPFQQRQEIETKTSFKQTNPPKQTTVDINDCSKTPDGRCCVSITPSETEMGHYDDVPWPVHFSNKKLIPKPDVEVQHDSTKLILKNDNKPIQLEGCTDSLNNKGTAAVLPNWLVPIWNKITSSVSDVNELSNRLIKGGSVLTVWIPSKFMSPQKPGKNVRGEMIDAATRGQNNSYYLSEFKSTFDTSVTISDVTYHAQVISRKGLVTCFWERLHIKRFDCNGMIPIYFCQCRHCKDIAAPADIQTAHKFNSGIPSLVQVPNIYRNANIIPKKIDKNIYKNTKEIKETGKCVDGLAAPWLIPRNRIQKLPYEGYHHDVEKLLEVQADSNGVVVVYIFNRFWVDHLHNVVYSMVGRSGVTNYIIATLDCDSLALCIKNRLPCLDGSMFAESERDMEVGGSGFNKGFQRKVTEELSWIKPRLALKILSLGYHFLMADMDLSWNINPLQNVASRNLDFAHQCDSNNHQSINTGFYLLVNNNRTVRLFESIMVFPPWRLSDQNALKLAAKYDHSHGASNNCLDRWLYNMKCNYKVPSSEKTISGKRTFKWKPQQRDPSKFDWFIFHATCLDGALAKIDWLRASNAWFLDKLDEITSSPYCIQVGDDTLQEMTRKTLHSEKYPTSRDETYLNERH